MSENTNEYKQFNLRTVLSMFLIDNFEIIQNEMENKWHFDYVRLAWDSGFCFVDQKAKTVIDLSSIGLVDVPKVVSDRDVGVIERHISTIVDYQLDEEQRRILDATFVKVFQLGQLSIQYLLFCKKYLDRTVTLLKQELGKSNTENKKLLEELENQKTETVNQKRKVKDLKQILEHQHQLVVSNAFRCEECPKMFATDEYLAAHIKRRHDTNPNLQMETDKLQLEIKELKERLNCTEKFMQNDPEESAKSEDNRTKIEENPQVTELQFELEKLKAQVRNQVQVLEDQKFYHDKYEKWMEMVFQKFEMKQKEIVGKAENIISHFDKRDSCTQTMENLSKETQCEEEKVDKGNNVNQEEFESIKCDLYKTQKEIEMETNTRFEKLEAVLEEKVMENFGKFTKQMEAFWDKMNENISKKEIKLPENEKKAVTIPKPPPRISNCSTLFLKTTDTNKKQIIETEPEEVLQVKENIVEDIGVFKKSQPKVPDPVKENYPEVTVIKSAQDFESSNSEELSSESDSEDNSQIELKPFTKPSVASTLGQHSLTSLKRASLEESVAKGLYKEIEDVLGIRLKNLGVSPDWPSLPQRSYQKAIKIVKHQSSLASKNIHNYEQIKEDILKKIDSSVRERIQNKKTERNKRTKKISRHPQAPVLSPSTTAPLKDRNETKQNEVEEVVDDASSSLVSQQIETKGNFVEISKTNTKKKVLFDLESLSSPDASGDHLKGNIRNNPVYIDELKEAVKLKAKGSDTSLESSILDEVNDKDRKVSKDFDASDWDVSDILK